MERDSNKTPVSNIVSCRSVYLGRLGNRDARSGHVPRSAAARSILINFLAPINAKMCIRPAPGQNRHLLIKSTRKKTCLREANSNLVSAERGRIT